MGFQNIGVKASNVADKKLSQPEEKKLLLKNT